MKKNKNELVERLDLGDFINTPVRQLSLGQKNEMRIGSFITSFSSHTISR